MRQTLRSSIPNRATTTLSAVRQLVILLILTAVSAVGGENLTAKADPAAALVFVEQPEISATQDVWKSDSASTVIRAEATIEPLAGEPVNGFANWSERVIHEWINRARSDPQFEMAQCGSACGEALCYLPVAPLLWSEALNRAARFHADNMTRMGFFDHTSRCLLVTDLYNRYPASCDGSASCACVGGLPTGQTPFSTRISLFGGSASGEIIASTPDPDFAFRLWLYESSADPTCQFSFTNGHRWNILKSEGAVGAGVAGNYSVADFGFSATVVSKIPSGAHYPRQADTVDFWANWFDVAGPSSAAVVLDGVPRPMVRERGTATNGAYHARLSGLGTGCHPYFFSFQDSTGAVVRYPTTGAYNVGSGTGCPDWTPSATGGEVISTRGDFNGDGRDDILFRHSATGEIWIWTMNGRLISSSNFVRTVADVNFRIAGTGDFDGDGRTDILFRHTATGEIWVWTMNGPLISSSNFVRTVADANFRIAGTGDFNGDGRSDILFRHTVTGEIWIWTMNGPLISSSNFVRTVADVNFRIAGTGDFNGDGRRDILFRHTMTGEIWIWMMNGPAISTSNFVYTVTAANFGIAGTGDFNGDGRSDILFRSATTGEIWIWLMNGASINAANFVYTIGDANFKIIGNNDFNGDARSDILFRHTNTGEVWEWLMNGTSISSTGHVYTIADANFKIMAPN